MEKAKSNGKIQTKTDHQKCDKITNIYSAQFHSSEIFLIRLFPITKLFEQPTKIPENRF